MISGRVALGVVLLVLCSVNLVVAQQKGHPFIRYYSPEEYGAQMQVHDIIQTSSFIMAATGTGIVTYDGERFAPVQGQPLMVTKMAHFGIKGTFYGSSERIGQVLPLQSGGHYYHHLNELLDSTMTNYGFMLDIHEFRGNVLFVTSSRILKYTGEQVEAIESPSGSLYLSFLIGNELYIGERDRGLLQLNESDELVTVPGGDYFSTPDRIPAHISQFDDYNLLIGTPKDGFYLLTVDSLSGKPTGTRTRFETDLDPILDNYAIGFTTTLRNGNIALATTEPAVHIISPEGKLIQSINEYSGIKLESILRLFEDRQGNLWFGTNNGMYLAEINHPMTQYTAASELEGIVINGAKFNETMYIATSVGLFRQDGDHFERISGVNGLTWDLETWVNPSNPDQEILLIANQFGFYTYANERLSRYNESYSTALKVSDINPNRITVGAGNGIYQMEWNGSRFDIEHDLIMIGNPVRTILEDSLGGLWLATQSNGIRYLNESFEESSLRAYHHETTNYEVSGNSNIAWVDGELMLSTMFFYYRYNPETDAFEEFRLPGLTDEDHYGIYLHDYYDGDYWVGESLFRESASVYKSLKSGERIKMDAPFRIVPDGVTLFMEKIDDSVWFGSPSGLFVYDMTTEITPKGVFHVNFQDISIQIADSVINVLPALGYRPQIDFNNGRYVFYASANWFDSSNKLEYRFKLEGLDEDWTDWSDVSTVEYTALREGNYTIQVEARNREGAVVRTEVWFRVNPPWHRAWWAYLSYFLIAIGLMYVVSNSIARSRTRRLERFNAELEEQVRIRSEELRQRNQSLRQLNDEKNDFMNIATHDLRNPLSGIQGIASIMIDTEHELQAETIKEYGSILHRSSRQMFEIIDSYLNVHRIEQGLVKPVLDILDLGEFAENAVSRFETQLSNKKMTITKSLNLARISADGAFLQQIFDNLMSNAIKYSPIGSEISIKTWSEGDKSYLSISDQGPGIPNDKKDELYKKFSKIGNRPTGGEQSVGLGLSIVKQLVEMMGGEISCKSEPGKGSEFIVAFTFVKG
jgi:signal transduction histidine kinase